MSKVSELSRRGWDGEEVGELLPDPPCVTPQMWLDQQSWPRRRPWISC